MQSQWHPVPSLVGAALVAVLFAPLKGRLQASVNRLIYGERDEPYRAVSRLGERLEGSIEPDAVLSTVVQTVASALRLPYVCIKLPDGESIEAASLRKPLAPITRLPLLHAGEQVGELIVASRPGQREPADPTRAWCRPLHDRLDQPCTRWRCINELSGSTGRPSI